MPRFAASRARSIARAKPYSAPASLAFRKVATRTKTSVAPCRLNSRCTSRTVLALRRPSASVTAPNTASVNGLTESDTRNLAHPA